MEKVAEAQSYALRPGHSAELARHGWRQQPVRPQSGVPPGPRYTWVDEMAWIRAHSLWWSLAASAALATVAALGAGCDTLGSIAVEATDFAGAKADAHCDRRYVTDGGQPAAFCQEVVATVAAAEFADDCRAKHKATAGAGLCPRPRIIAGCKLLEKHDDESNVWDWYYDVSDIVADAGPRAGPDGGPTFDSQPRSVKEVADYCADKSRYDLGAELATP